MAPQFRHSKHEEEQREAHRLLESEGPLTYEELRESLDVDQSTMQAVIRGLIDNGVVESFLDSEGHRYYSATEQ